MCLVILWKGLTNSGIGLSVVCVQPGRDGTFKSAGTVTHTHFVSITLLKAGIKYHPAGHFSAVS